MFMRKVLDAKLPSKLETSLLDKHLGSPLPGEERLEGKFLLGGPDSGFGGQVPCSKILTFVSTQKASESYHWAMSGIIKALSLMGGR